MPEPIHCPHPERIVFARSACELCYRQWWIVNTQRPIKHGTYYAYTRRKCRCEPCTRAKRDYQNANRPSRSEGTHE